MKVFIAGDVVPRHRTIELFQKKKTDRLFRDFIPYIKDADISIVNFEAPIIDGKETPIKKSGPALHTTQETLEVLKEAGFNTVTLANNHFRDQGQPGVDCTIGAAERLGIDYVGGGRTLEEARRILYKDVDGRKLAIINVCEHEFSIASNEYGGSNPIDTIDTYKDINTAKKLADYVLLIVHGGIEHYQLPTPRMKKLYRFFVDAGADAVINHHQHCFSGYEVYKGKPIFYGLGNFNFDSHVTNNTPTIWNKSYSVSLVFSQGNVSFDIYPHIQNSSKVGIQKMDADDFNSDMTHLNGIITDDTKLDKFFENYCSSKKEEFILSLLPIRNKYIKSIIRKGIFGNIYNDQQIRNIKNRLTCESHLDVLTKIFKSIGNECK